MRSLKALWRQPAFAVATLVQPIIWLLLFGALFSRVVEIPGFDASRGSYLEFLTPGVVVMTALFSSGWAGTIYIDDMNRGVMDRFLASPVRRGALMAGSLAYQAATTVVQTVVVLVVAGIAGARFPGGAAGILVTLAAACLISVIMASFSNALALLLRSQEALIGVSQFVVLPLQFLSSALLDDQRSPPRGWPTWRASTPSTGPSSHHARRWRPAPTGRRCGAGSVCSLRSRWSWPGSARGLSGRTSGPSRGLARSSTYLLVPFPCPFSSCSEGCSAARLEPQAAPTSGGRRGGSPHPAGRAPRGAPGCTCRPRGTTRRHRLRGYWE